MRVVDADRRLSRAEVRHRVHLDLTHFESGIAAWRAVCTCGWKSSVKTTEVDAAARTALGHTRGAVFGMGVDLFDAS
jgi:hypothetical protein